MKPRELFGGPAPAAQSMMGQGIMEAGANIARSIQSGYEAFGRGIGAGLQSVGEAYAKHKETQQSNKAYEDLLKNPAAQKAFGINKDQATQMLIEADNLGTKSKAKFFESFFPVALKQSMFSQELAGQERMAKILSGYKMEEMTHKNRLENEGFQGPPIDFSSSMDKTPYGTQSPAIGKGTKQIPSTNAPQPSGSASDNKDYPAGPQGESNGRSPLIPGPEGEPGYNARYSSLSQKEKDYLARKNVTEDVFDNLHGVQRSAYFNMAKQFANRTR